MDPGKSWRFFGQASRKLGETTVWNHHRLYDQKYRTKTNKYGEYKQCIKLEARKMEHDIMIIPATLDSFWPHIKGGPQPSGHPACAWAAREGTPPLAPGWPEMPAAFGGPGDLRHRVRGREI